jgi:hypothetical protein
MRNGSYYIGLSTVGLLVETAFAAAIGRRRWERQRSFSEGRRTLTRVLKLNESATGGDRH